MAGPKNPMNEVARDLEAGRKEAGFEDGVFQYEPPPYEPPPPLDPKRFDDAGPAWWNED